MNVQAGTYQTDGPGPQVQEAPKQVQSSQSMDLTEENLRGHRSKVKQVLWKPRESHQRQEEEEEVEERRDLWRNRWLHTTTAVCVRVCVLLPAVM